MITPDIAKTCVESIPGVTPRLSTRGANKGIAHVQYGYRFSLGNRDICIATRPTESGITVYVNQTSLANKPFPDAQFPAGTITEKYAQGYKGITGDMGLSAAAAKLPSINPAHNDSMRLSISDVGHFERFLAWYFDLSSAAAPASDPAASPTPTPVAVSAPTDPDEAGENALVNALTPTERKAWLKVRYGQGRFRDVLMAHSGPQCWMTGIQGRELLVASHIQPWACCGSNPQDRLSVDNGLLLSALWDAAFDAGLVTFDANWQVIASPQLSESALRELGLDRSIILPYRFRSAGRKQFMAYHREHVFKR